MDASNSLNYSYLRHSLSLLISQQEASIKRLQNNDSLEKHKIIFPNDFSSVQQYDRVAQTANEQRVKSSISKADFLKQMLILNSSIHVSSIFFRK